ncbi:MAG: FecR domain-containing protein [Hyphomicrobiaceae bacterium]
MLGDKTIQPDEDDQNLSREALHWLIALQEEPDDRLLHERFRAWLATSPDHERAWREAERVWNVLDDVPREAGTRSSAARKAQSPSRTQSAGGAASIDARAAPVRRSRVRWLGGIGAGLLAACLLIAYLPVFAIWLSADYSTGTAEVRQIRLEDGSTVYLGAGSAMKLAFAPGSRRVALLAGQAYFEVAPDRTRPFTVESGDVETTVLGTAFDVRMLSSGVAVAVGHGRVAVAGSPEAKAPDQLGPGDWTRLSRDGRRERGTGAAAGAWRQGNMIVSDVLVADVVDELRRYYGGKIVLLNGDLASRRVTGVYRLADPIEALRAVAEAHGATVREISPWLVVVYGG